MPPETKIFSDYDHQKMLTYNADQFAKTYSQDFVKEYNRLLLQDRINNDKETANAVKAACPENSKSVGLIGATHLTYSIEGINPGIDENLAEGGKKVGIIALIDKDFLQIYMQSFGRAIHNKFEYPSTIFLLDENQLSNGKVAAAPYQVAGIKAGFAADFKTENLSLETPVKYDPVSLELLGQLSPEALIAVDKLAKSEFEKSQAK
jgi:hypothetical protein